jgi:hypothetical protein
MKKARQDSLWGWVELRERHHIKAWCQLYYPALQPSDALANHVKRIETTATRLRGGNVLVTISVLARKEHESQSDAFRLQIAGNKVVEVASEVSTTG